MADFCRQCAFEMFPPDVGQDDMLGLTTEEQTNQGLYALVLCECCGATQVDHTGKCIHHKKSDEGHKHCGCSLEDN